MKRSARFLWIALFGIAFAYVEAAVVVYLRELFYPDGFAFPLRPLPNRLLGIEILRELATLAMLVAVAALPARRFWERFGYFLILFGVWDIFYYVWLKLTLDWPATLLDGDILFLIPLPWIGPVLAPLLVSVVMIAIGFSITRLYDSGRRLSVSALAWIGGLLATLLILYSFMRDLDAGLRLQPPQPYPYGFLVAGLVVYVLTYLRVHRDSVRGCASPSS